MKKLFITLNIFSSLVLANNITNNFTNYMQTQQQNFTNYKQSLDEGFKEYKATLNKAFQEYKKSLAVYWKNPELTTKTTFIEYSKDKKVRKKVDYANNYIEIDVIAKDPKKATQQIAINLYHLTTESTQTAFNNNPVLTKVNQQLANKYPQIIKISKPSNEPIVADMIFQNVPTKQQAANYTIKTIKTHKIVKVPSKIPNTYVYKLRIPLPKNAILAKAKLYKNSVFKRAKQFKLTPEFVFAIIHTESSFNPMARSYVPAFGLMQIVPQTAGADAYKMLTGHKKILTPSFLYNANNNILIGSAYLYKIYYGYMKNVKDPLSRLYCTIAAYNTGAGNVACAFNSTSKDYKGRTICVRSRGDYNIIKASSKINKLTPSQVYNHLLANLRYDEPKNYLKRVTKRFLIYKKALNTNAL